MAGVTNNKLNNNLWEQNSGAPLYRGSETFAWLHRDLQKNPKMKILIMYRLWSKCVPMSLKRTNMTFQIKLTHNFGPLSITFSPKCLFSAKMAIFCVFDRIGYRKPKQFQSNWIRWFFLVNWYTFLPQSKQNSKFEFFAFLQIPMGVRGIFRPPIQGVPVNWFQNFYHLWYCTIILHTLRVGK